MSKENINDLIRETALNNAIKHLGRARDEPVIGQILAIRPDLREKIKELTFIIHSIVEEINDLGLDKQKVMAKEFHTPLQKQSIHTQKILPPLPKNKNYKEIRLRFCPNPDGPLHLGGSRAAILCDEYSKMYSGRFILRFDDTDPRIKYPLKEAYDWIRSDLKWLGVEWHEEAYQSDRFELYYSHAESLIKNGHAYVCICKPEDFRKNLLAFCQCPCRNLAPDTHLSRWYSMLDGGYNEGEAVVRIRTDLNHPNPAVRDWPALRIINTLKTPHPRTGSKYRVWPLFAFCCGIDDHEFRISHILRGKEHLTNSVRQAFLYEYFGWIYPEAIHYGRMKTAGVGLSKSKIRKAINEGLYSGWDDPRLGTLLALKRRGFLPESIRKIIIDFGIKPVDITVNFENLEAYNRKLLDSKSNRYSFVSSPVVLYIEGVEKSYNSRKPLHPDFPSRGCRENLIKPSEGTIKLLLSNSDLKILNKNKIVRLIDLFNIEIIKIGDDIKAIFYSEPYLDAKKIGASLIHWIIPENSIKTKIVMPDSSMIEGLAEEECRNLSSNDIIQFERFGFVRIDKINENLFAYYAHR